VIEVKVSISDGQSVVADSVAISDEELAAGNWRDYRLNLVTLIGCKQLDKVVSQWLENSSS
jgi:hypothetical protein